jgi:polyphenol oxidase
VMVADPATGRVASCHAGWRGVAGRILPEAIGLMEREGSRRGDLLVALGPAVSGANYQVERSVTHQVASSLLPDRLDGVQEKQALFEELTACGAVLEDPEPERDRLDIRTATCRQLEREGIAAERISVCPLCTVAEPLLFHSWRRDRVKAVQWSGIVSQA